MGEILGGLVLGWLLGVFTPQILEPVSRVIGTIWHVATRRSLDHHDEITYAIHRSAKMYSVRHFFRIRQPTK